MGKPIEITRTEFSASELRELAASTHNGATVRRLLALALVLEGHCRAEAARLNGTDRQTLRDWVHRYNEEGAAELRSRLNQPRPTAGETCRSEFDRRTTGLGGERTFERTLSDDGRAP
jgi:hypothetical protein